MLNSHKRASMRPAHQAREVSQLHRRSCQPAGRFNEARASSAGSKRRLMAMRRCRRRFNEARASSAGSKIRRNPCKSHAASASMRPAHQAREVTGISASLSRTRAGFNEARASSAGSKRIGDGTRFCNWCFNEARASSAGSNSEAEIDASIAASSMRPAHQAREVKTAGCATAPAPDIFNEARASSAGSKRARRGTRPRRRSLQ